ncbi:MAG TPA: nitroreductase family deazaflavin-dependent oxidoreductase [Ktedonobacteraceae bacterium]|nr:nitroreductase family deazaflavin-dependent oxidoreductase [Ktedonobacteraceae bacterium]
MAKKSQVPFFVRAANVLTMTMLRAGFKINGFGKSQYPMYILTVRGRKSGLPRSVPIVTLERNGQRYLVSPYGIVDWVRNLQAAGEATLVRGRRSEILTAQELPPKEAALVLREDIRGGNPFARNYGVGPQSPLEDYEQVVLKHPVFLLQRV